jgi:hypothetical protein
MATNKAQFVSKEDQEAADRLANRFMSVSEVQKALGVGTYQYARQMIFTNRYGLGDATIEIAGRTYVSREAVNAAVKIRAERKAEQQEVDETA